jgi:hypothetical protein
MVVVFPPSMDNWDGVVLVMQPPLQTHLNLAALLAAVAAVALVALLANWLTSSPPEDNVGRR